MGIDRLALAQVQHLGRPQRVVGRRQQPLAGADLLLDFRQARLRFADVADIRFEQAAGADTDCQTTYAPSESRTLNMSLAVFISLPAAW